MGRKEELAKEEQVLYEKLNKIKEEKNAIHEEELKAKKKEVEKEIDYIRKHQDIILPLISHDCSSCSDEIPSNGYSHEYGAKCRKCHLIEILNNEWGTGDFEVDFEIIITPTEVY